VKKLEVRAMLADQTIEEMEQQLFVAETMTEKTNLEVLKNCMFLLFTSIFS